MIQSTAEQKEHEICINEVVTFLMDLAEQEPIMKSILQRNQDINDKSDR